MKTCSKKFIEVSSGSFRKKKKVGMVYWIQRVWWSNRKPWLLFCSRLASSTGRKFCVHAKSGASPEENAGTTTFHLAELKKKQSFTSSGGIFSRHQFGSPPK